MCICARILTGAECVVARLCLPVAAGANSTSFRRWGVVAETDPRDVSFATRGRARRPRGPQAPVSIRTRWT